MKTAGLLLFVSAVASVATIGGSIRCYECSSQSECDAAIADQTEPQESSEVYVAESGEIRPEFDRCLRITDVGPIPMYKRVCGNQRIYGEYLDDCALSDCAVLACYSDKFLI